MTPRLTPNPWVAGSRSNAEARLRLFCFPYAGGGASIYRDWTAALPPVVEVYPVQLPGRQSRLHELPFTRMSLLVPELVEGLQPYLDRPFAFWGHSMGALISFELARHLSHENRPGPLHLFVSGYRAPQLPRLEPPIHQLPEEAFIHELHRLNGTPDAVLQNRELMRLLDR